MPTLPLILPLAFILTTGFSIFLFGRACPRTGPVLVGVLAWALGQGMLALSGFYTITNSLPPRLGLAIGPPLLGMLGLLSTRAGRRWLAELRLPALTLLHVVRLPVELVLWQLSVHGAVPRLMTFEGQNWDILMGLTAPLVWVLAFRYPVLGRRGLLLWNLLGVGLLLNIVGRAILATPTPWQQLGFEQPNVAVLFFPFSWLPAVVVPLVMLAHLAALRQLWSWVSLPPAQPRNAVS